MAMIVLTPMKLVVQKVDGKMFLCEDGEWTASRSRAKTFATALDAVTFCIEAGRRDVRLAGENERGEEVYLYPFGGDPVVKIVAKTVRKRVRDERRLARERRMLEGLMKGQTAGEKKKKW